MVIAATKATGFTTKPGEKLVLGLVKPIFDVWKKLLGYRLDIKHFTDDPVNDTMRFAFNMGRWSPVRSDW